MSVCNRFGYYGTKENLKNSKDFVGLAGSTLKIQSDAALA